MQKVKNHFGGGGHVTKCPPPLLLSVDRVRFPVGSNQRLLKISRLLIDSLLDVWHYEEKVRGNPATDYGILFRGGVKSCFELALNHPGDRCRRTRWANTAREVIPPRLLTE